MKKNGLILGLLCLSIAWVGCTKTESRGKLSLDAASKAWIPADADKTIVYQDSMDAGNTRSFVFGANELINELQDVGCERSFLKTTCYNYEVEAARLQSFTDSLVITYAVIKSGDLDSPDQLYDVYTADIVDYNQDVAAQLGTVVKGGNFTPDSLGYTEIPSLTMQGVTHQNVLMRKDTLSNMTLYVTKEKGIVAYQKSGRTFVRQ
ncbi:MAG: hypothetical protein ACKVTZ_23465 [Bacteroidia bacterium]